MTPSEAVEYLHQFFDLELEENNPWQGTPCQCKSNDYEAWTSTCYPDPLPEQRCVIGNKLRHAIDVLREATR